MFQLIPARLQLIVAVAASAVALSWGAAWGQPAPANPVVATGPGAQAQATVPIERVIEGMQRWAAAHPGQPMTGKFAEQITTGGGRVDAFNGTSTGPGLAAWGDHKAPADFTGAAGSVTPPGGGGAETGAFKGHASPENDVATRWWANPLFWAGLVCFILAGALFVVPKVYPLLFPHPIDPKVPVGIAGLGAALWVAVFWPAVLLFAILGGLVWLLAPMILHAIQAARQKAQDGALMEDASNKLGTLTEGLRAAADGIAKLPEITKATVLRSSAGEAEAEHGDHETIEGHVDPSLQPFRIPRDPAGQVA